MRRNSIDSIFDQETVVVVSDAGRWRKIKALNEEEEYVSDRDYEDYEEEEEDRSLDLLVRFLHNVFRNISRRVRKAVRSVLPVPIPTKLVSAQSSSSISSQKFFSTSVVINISDIDPLCI